MRSFAAVGGRLPVAPVHALADSVRATDVFRRPQMGPAPRTAPPRRAAPMVAALTVIGGASFRTRMVRPRDGATWHRRRARSGMRERTSRWRRSGSDRWTAWGAIFVVGRRAVVAGLGRKGLRSGASRPLAAQIVGLRTLGQFWPEVGRGGR